MKIRRFYQDILSLFIVLISGVIHLASSASQGPNDAVANEGGNVTFTYTNDAITNTDFYLWVRYEPQQNTIYQSTDQQIINPGKYNVSRNGSFNLMVYKVTKQDARTYCFISPKAKNASCANLAVIDSIESSVYPSNGVSVGQLVNLTCQVEYGSPTSDVNNVKPLSPDQNPQLMMYIGNTQITNVIGEQIIGQDETTHSKSISVNRTILKTDVGQDLTCVVRTKNPSFQVNDSTPLNVRYPTADVSIDFWVNSSSDTDMTWCCPLQGVINCTADGFPYPTITWINELGQVVQPLRYGNGFSTVQVTREGTYTWNCSSRNDLSNATVSDFITISTNGALIGQNISHSNSIHGFTILWLVILMVAFQKMFT